MVAVTVPTLTQSPCFLRSTLSVATAPAIEAGLASPLAWTRLPSFNAPFLRPCSFRLIEAASGEGDGVGLGDGVTDGEGVGVPVELDDGAGVGDGVALGVGVGVALGVGLGVGVGVPATVKLAVLVTVPPEVVTVIWPSVASDGTVAAIWVSLSTVKLAALPLKLTAVAPLNPLPLSVTTLPTAPAPGVKPASVGVGMTVKLCGLASAAPGTVTVISPLEAPAGTTATRVVSLTTLNVAGVPSKATALASPRPPPESVTRAPTAAEAGQNEHRRGEVAVVTT